MEGILKKVAHLKDAEAIIQVMRESADPWLHAQKWVHEMITSKKLKNRKAKYVLLSAAGWIAEQYKCLFQQKQQLEEEVEFFKAGLKFHAQQEAAFSAENKHIVDENMRLHNEITFLTESLSDAQATIREICSKPAKMDHSQSTVDGDHSVIAVIETDSGVEIENVENRNTVAVGVSHEVIGGECSSDNESVGSHNSSHCNVSQLPCGQRGAYARRPALRCFVCQKFGHIARYCSLSNTSKQRNFQFPRTTPRCNEVYSARWGSAPRHVTHNRPIRDSFKAQISRLRSENIQLKQQRHQFMEQVRALKMVVTQRYHTGVNNSLVNKP